MSLTAYASETNEQNFEMYYKTRIEDRGSRIEDRGWRMEDGGSRIGDRPSRIGQKNLKIK